MTSPSAMLLLSEIFRNTSPLAGVSRAVWRETSLNEANEDFIPSRHLTRSNSNINLIHITLPTEKYACIKTESGVFRNEENYVGFEVLTAVVMKSYTECVNESGDFKNVMNSKLLHLFGFNTYEYSVNIKAFGSSQLTLGKQKRTSQKLHPSDDHHSTVDTR
jgi:hypothetical protein